MFYTCVSHIQPFVKIIGQFFLIKRFLQTCILQNGFCGPHFAICFEVLPESLKAFLRNSIFMTLMIIFFNGEDRFEKFLPLCCICTSYNIDNYDIILSRVRKRDGHIKAITILKIWINWPLNGLVGKSSKIYLTIYKEIEQSLSVTNICQYPGKLLRLKIDQ